MFRAEHWGKNELHGACNALYELSIPDNLFDLLVSDYGGWHGP